MCVCRLFRKENEVGKVLLSVDSESYDITEMVQEQVIEFSHAYDNESVQELNGVNSGIDNWPGIFFSGDFQLRASYGLLGGV